MTDTSFHETPEQPEPERLSEYGAPVVVALSAASMLQFNAWMSPVARAFNGLAVHQGFLDDLDALSTAIDYHARFEVGGNLLRRHRQRRRR